MWRSTSNDVRSRLLLAGSALGSWLFLYPLVHELGHLLAARWFGANVAAFVWTPILGKPHVSLNNVSGAAMPWVDAGGVLLPTAVGVVTTIGWLVWLHRTRWCFALVLIPAVVMLLGNLGLLLEAFTDSGYHHMRGLARAGLEDRNAAIVAEIAPALLSVMLIAAVIWRLRDKRQPAESAAT